jgi:outer membrane protein OmpA-like peptidoglycan-associated protein
VGNSAAARSDPPAPPGADGPASRFAELRSLLFGPEQRQLRALQARLDDPGTQAREVSQVLPQAVQLRTHDPQLTRALAPSIEEGISALVRRDPKQLADALFPAIMPAIRKAIAATLSGMLESLNRTLEHSLSWRSVQWRITALRTGKSFAEIVLLNTLVYRVEQVLLIHRESGLLLQHVKSGPASVQDADLVSGMLTAIRDFVQDSFRVSEHESLDTLQVGELSVWIEQGPHAVLAAVIRGTAPADLHATLQEALESIHAHFGDRLETFAGDTSTFDAAQPLIENCLQVQYRTDTRKRAPFVAIFATVLLLALGVWAFIWWQSRARWNAYLASLRAEPGIVVVSSGRSGGKYLVSGLRDPLARDPAALLASHRFDASQVDGRWQFYQALDPALVLARAKEVLRPPSGVTLRLDGGVLSAAGTAPVDWIDDAIRVARVVPGVSRFDFDSVVDSEVKRLMQGIEADAVLFTKGTSTLTGAGTEALSRQIQRLRSLERLAGAGGRAFTLDLVGQADADGPPESNVPLSRHRADRVLAALTAERFERIQLGASGIGSDRAAGAESGEDEKQRNRRVAFHVTETARRADGASAR